MASEAGDAGGKPLWRRILDFPLVAMIFALMVLYAGVQISLAISQAMPPLSGFDPRMQFDMICGPVFVILYLLIIRHLGDPKRNDLRLRGALRPLGLGLLAGVVIFSVVVAIAAVLGLYRIIGEGDATGLPEALIASAIFPAV